MGANVIMEPTKSSFGIRYISPEIAASGKGSIGVLTLRSLTVEGKQIGKNYRRGVYAKTLEEVFRELLEIRKVEHGLPYPTADQFSEALVRLEKFFLDRGVAINGPSGTLKKTTAEEALDNIRGVFSKLRNAGVETFSIFDDFPPAARVAKKLYDETAADGWSGFNDAVNEMTVKDILLLRDVAVWSHDGEMFIGVANYWDAVCEKSPVES